MSFSKFSEINSFSIDEIFKALQSAEGELFNIRFQKATRQNFKSHEITKTKRRIAQLKTLLTKIQNN